MDYMVIKARLYTVKLEIKGQPREIQNLVFIDKWSFFGGFFFLINEGLSEVAWHLRKVALCTIFIANVDLLTRDVIDSNDIAVSMI